MQPASKNRPSKPTGQVTLEDCLLILLRGIQNHSVIADGSDGQEFRAELAALKSRFQGKENAHQLVDTAVEILDKYGTQTNQVIARQKSDLVTAAAQLSEAVKTLPEIQRSAERLSKLEQQINEISADDDLDAVKARLCADVAAARAAALQEGHKISELFSGVPASWTSLPSEIPPRLEARVPAKHRVWRVRFIRRIP